MSEKSDQELVLLMDSKTGEIRLEKSSFSIGRNTTMLAGVFSFHTGLAYDAGVAQKVRLALNSRGVKVNGVAEKCINISKDWLVQILVILYYALPDSNSSDRFAYMIHIVTINSVWKNNPGIEHQRHKDEEYWNKVEQFNRSRANRTTDEKRNQSKRIGLKTLVVEDEFISRKIMLHCVSPLGECDVASNGTEAIDAFMLALNEGEYYDLILLDIIMPDMSGLEVLQRIRGIEQKQGGRATRIIMTTSLNNMKDVMSAFSGECDGYLVKPIQNSALRNLLYELELLN